MCASRRSAIWAAIGCHFVNRTWASPAAAAIPAASPMFSAPIVSRAARRTGSIPQTAPVSVESQPLPHLAGNSADGVSGGGRGMGSYQPGKADVTGSLRRPPPPPPAWTWEGGTAVTVAPGRDARNALRAAWRARLPPSWKPTTSPARRTSTPGSIWLFRVIAVRRRPFRRRRRASPRPRRCRPGAVRRREARSRPRRLSMSWRPAKPSTASRGSITSRLLVLAKANNIPPDTQLRVGDRIVIPGARSATLAGAARASRRSAGARRR